MPISWERFEELRTAAHGGIRLAAYSSSIAAATGSTGNHRQIKLAAVSSRFFTDFASRLAAGRDFTTSEEQTPGQRAAILSFHLAVTEFGSSRNAVGQSLEINGSPYLVVGVASEAFHGLWGESSDAWVPANCVVPLVVDAPPGLTSDSGVWKVLNNFYIAAATTAMSPSALLALEHESLPLRVVGKPLLRAEQGLTIDPARDQRIRKWLRLGLGLSIAFALISCLNACLLLLARVPLQLEEVRLKRALGAGPRRILVEFAAGPVATMAIGLSGAFLFWLTAMAATARLSNLNRLLLLGSSSAVLHALAVQMALVFCLLLVVSVIPAFVAVGSNRLPRMGHSSTANRGVAFIMQIPVALQMACGIVVWILASMVVCALLTLMRQPLGFDPNHRTVVCIAPAGDRITIHGATGNVSPEFLALNRVMERVRELPGVHSVSYANNAPLDQYASVESVQRADVSSAPARAANATIITSGYFQTAGSRILRGRDVSTWTVTGASNEIVINKLLADELFRNDDPIGKTVNVIVPAHFGIQTYKYPVSVVGVVENARDAGYASTPVPTFFQEGHAYGDVRPHLIVDGTISARALEEAAKQIVSELMPGMGVARTYNLEEELDASLAPERHRAYGALVAAAIMACVVFIGQYGAFSFYLRSRRKEIAVRICLGACRGTIRRLVITRAVLEAWCAILLSLPLWIPLHRLSSSVYLGPVAWSSIRAIAIATLYATMTVLLALIPVAATHIAPSEVLKEE